MRKPERTAQFFCLTALYLSFAVVAGIYLRDLSKQFREKSQAYYHQEYSALTELVQHPTMPDPKKAGGWRRGPMAYFWMWPLAKVYGDALPREIIYLVQIVIVVFCVALTVMTFGSPERYFFEIPLYSIFWLGSTSFKYVLELADVNAALGLCLFPMLAFFLCTRKRWRAGGVVIAMASHFRVLAVAQTMYLSLRSRKAFLSILATSAVILMLGTLWIGSDQGYLYWFRVAMGILFTEGSMKGSAPPTWHENVAVPAILARFASGFNFGGSHDAILSESAIRVCTRVGILIQLGFIALIARMVWRDKTLERLDDRVESPLFKALLFVEAAIGFSLTYFLAPEFVEELFVTLMPLYCVGAYLLITRWQKISVLMKFVYIAAILFTLNLFGTQWLCNLLQLDFINHKVGNKTAFICFELISVYLINWVGLVLCFTFVVRSWFDIRKEIRLSDCEATEDL